VEAATLHNFVAYETLDNHAFGRGFKVDLGEVAGTVVALREWMARDHEASFAEQERRLGTIARALAGLPHVRTEQVWLHRPFLQLRITLGAPAPHSLAAVEQGLRAGDPSVRIRLEGDALEVCAHLLTDGETEVVAERLRRALGAGA
jgi:seryl-tRNA(Sec) selenium transferase